MKLGYTPTVWKARECVQNNAPNYWIVTDRAFKGHVLCTTDKEESAQLIAQAVNAHGELVAALKEAVASLEWTAAVMPDIPAKSAFRENLADAISTLANIKNNT